MSARRRDDDVGASGHRRPGDTGSRRNVCLQRGRVRRVVERDLHRAAVTGRFDTILTTEHVDELAPEARAADAIQQEVDGVVGVGEQVKDDPHHAQSAFGNGSRVLAQRVRDD